MSIQDYERDLDPDARQDLDTVVANYFKIKKQVRKEEDRILDETGSVQRLSSEGIARMAENLPIARRREINEE